MGFGITDRDQHDDCLNHYMCGNRIVCCWNARPMDKVHWISILLDKETDMDAAKRMLDESYALVEKSGRKGRRKVKK